MAVSRYHQSLNGGFGVVGLCVQPILKGQIKGSGPSKGLLARLIPISGLNRVDAYLHTPRALLDRCVCASKETTFRKFFTAKHCIGSATRWL